MVEQKRQNRRETRELEYKERTLFTEIYGL